MDDFKLIVFNLDLEKDRNTISTMHKENPNDYIIWEDEDSEYLEYSEWIYFGLYKNNVLVAVTSVEEITDTLCAMWSTIVKEDCRGQGIGRILNDHLETWLRDAGFEKISSHIYVENLPSIILKLKIGYLIEGTLMNHDAPGQHEYILGKEL